ncbi:SpoIIE family protein phosphatase [Streptomyces sp. NPDC052721]|uniref:SpoIIE family protein phosphatase n=1 Tax=Streptomyces sp. NPDC052721 TaxID=3154955 RepID=UPI0034272485
MGNRSLILEAATELLEASPTGDVATRGVAEKAGVRPVIYRLFGDKDSLLAAVVDQGFARYLAAERAAEPTTDPVADLRRGWDQHTRFALEHPNLYRLVAAPGPACVPTAIDEMHALLHATLERVARAGRLALEPDRAADTVISANTGVALTLLTRPRMRPDTDLSARVRDVVPAGVLTPEMSVGDSSPPVRTQRAATTLSALLRRDPPRSFTPAERALLSAWLTRLIDGGAIPGSRTGGSATGGSTDGSRANPHHGPEHDVTAATTKTSTTEVLPAWNRGSHHPLWLAVPLLLVIAIPTADAFLPPDIHLAHLLVVAAALTAMAYGPRPTALVGALAVLALITAGTERGTLVTESVLVELCTLAALCALLVAFTHLRDRRGRELLRARAVSDTAQRVVLRPLPTRAGPLSLAGEYHSAEADTYIGGDLYAAARTSRSTRLVIGDVRGKGLASISDTAIVLGAFRAAAHRPVPLPELVAYVEDAVRWGLQEFSEVDPDVGERFVTAVVLDIPDDQPVVHMISCGHPPPLLLCRSSGTATALHVTDPAPPLGLGALSDTTYTAATFPFHDGDRILLYTDGVTETRDSGGAFYPLAERLAKWSDLDPGPLLREIVADLRDHAGGLVHDDMAMMVVQRDEAPAAG